MKSILISIKPKHCANILNRFKTKEIRKRFPKKYRGWIYIYCTKDSSNLLHKNCVDIWWVEDKDFQKKNKSLGIETQPYLNGKLIARFYCDNVEEIKFNGYFYPNDDEYTTETMNGKELMKASCLDLNDLVYYLGNKNGYAINITKLEIFDTPKELSEFYKVGHYEDINDYFTDEKQISGKWCISLKKAPQSMMYIETDETR